MRCVVAAFVLGVSLSGGAAAQGLKCAIGQTFYSDLWQEVPDCAPARARAGDLVAQKEVVLKLHQKYPNHLVQANPEVVSYIVAGTQRGDPEIMDIHASVLSAMELRIESQTFTVDSYRPESDPYYSTRPEALRTLRSEKRQLEHLKTQYAVLGGSGRAAEIRAALRDGGKVELSNDVVADILAGGDSSPATNARLLQLLTEATALPDGAAEATLGWFYETGERWPADRQKAAEYYQSGWQKGSALATYHVGRNLLPGGLFVTDKARAYQLLSQAHDALLDLRKAAHDARDFVEREKLTEALALINGTLGPVAFDHAAGLALAGDMKGAFPHYVLAAQAGVQKAMLALGYMYRTGRGAPAISEDWEQIWFRNAAACSAETLALEANRYDQRLCDQANAELANINTRIEDRERAQQEATYAVLGLIGLALIGIGNAQEYSGTFQPPDLTGGPAMETAASLMWQNKW